MFGLRKGGEERSETGGGADCLGGLGAGALWFDTGLRGTPARLTTNGCSVLDRLGTGSPRTGFGGLVRREAHGCVGCRWRPCPWVPTRGTPTGSDAPANDGAARHERGVTCGGGSTRSGGYTGPAHHERGALGRLRAQLSDLLRHEADGCSGCLWGSCPWVPTRSTPTGSDAPPDDRAGSPRTGIGWGSMVARKTGGLGTPARRKE